MKTTILGHSGIEVTEMGLGNVDFGTKVGKDTAFRILDAYVDAGGNFIDTSNNYAIWHDGARGGECEQVIGEWIASRGARDKIVLATKVGANIHDPDSIRRKDGTLPDDWHLQGEGLSEKAIVTAVEGSLRRLGTDYIDLYYAHVEDRSVEPEETMNAFDRLYREGKIRAIGASNHKIWMVERARQVSRKEGLIEYCCVQDLHTYLQPLPSERDRYANPDTLDYLRSNPELSLVAYTPTLWGMYSRMKPGSGKDFWGAFYTRETDPRLRALEHLAEAKGKSVIQIVFAWLLQMQPSSIPLIATASVDHLLEDIQAADIHLTEDEMELLSRGMP